MTRTTKSALKQMAPTSAFVRVAGKATAVTALILTSAICVTITYAIRKQSARIWLVHFAVRVYQAGVETEEFARILMNVTLKERVTNSQTVQIRTDRIYAHVQLVSRAMVPTVHNLKKFLVSLLRKNT